MTRSVIWDMDGVLADSGQAHFAAWQALFDEMGLTMSWQQFADTFGMSNIPILRVCLGDDRPLSELESMAARKEALFREIMPEYVTILPGVGDWLDYASAQGYKQIVASSGEMANIAAVINTLGIGNYFQGILSGAFMPKSKPDPTIFLYAAAAAGAEPDQCVVIEDGIVGIEAAVRAGMRSIGVTTTHPANKLEQASVVLNRLSDRSPDLLDQLLNE